ncbi:unnamed protein product [Tetraodon nigroviridis]|uniref:(spotted green pufferfish) hypothetical protein n=1 Tax=Tetraodon nigroviridis TaxID=99883 RepID=Q4SCP2_TETNG|nr:unnamed protein product [Tetraodon nigroviridis]
MDRSQMQQVECQRSGDKPPPKRQQQLTATGSPVGNVGKKPGTARKNSLRQPGIFRHWRYALAGLGLFSLGLLIGWFLHTPTHTEPPDPPSDSSDLLEQLLHGISAEKINSLHNLDPSEDARASYLYRQWVGLGLNDVRISNHTVLLSLPGSTPNTITDRSSHQCFLPYGIPCDQRGLSDQDFPYAAYSASGSVQGEVVDVQYGSVEDLRKVRDNMNLTNQIAVLKLGQAPLLYTLSLLSELGFGGVLLYVDPCDAPPDRHTWHQAFRVTLNPGGNPTLSCWDCHKPSACQLCLACWILIFTVWNQLKPPDMWMWETDDVPGGNLASVLVQPVSAYLAKTLLSAPPSGREGSCVPIAMPSSAGNSTKYTCH